MRDPNSFMIILSIAICCSKYPCRETLFGEGGMCFQLDAHMKTLG
jgi:hypothetical protein